MNFDHALEDFTKNTYINNHRYNIEPAFYQQIKHRIHALPTSPFVQSQVNLTKHVDILAIITHTLSIHTFRYSNLQINQWNRPVVWMDMIHKIISTLILLTFVTLSVL
jgi:hypothetical protein